jgi:hypothetical protein
VSPNLGATSFFSQSLTSPSAIEQCWRRVSLENWQAETGRGTSLSINGIRLLLEGDSGGRERVGGGRQMGEFEEERLRLSSRRKSRL